MTLGSVQVLPCTICLPTLVLIAQPFLFQSADKQTDATERRTARRRLYSGPAAVLCAGLVTFSDGGHGLPRQEGKFDCGKLTESCECSSQVKKAQDAAATARNVAS